MVWCLLFCSLTLHVMTWFCYMKLVHFVLFLSCHYLSTHVHMHVYIYMDWVFVSLLSRLRTNAYVLSALSSYSGFIQILLTLFCNYCILLYFFLSCIQKLTLPEIFNHQKLNDFCRDSSVLLCICFSGTRGMCLSQRMPIYFTVTSNKKKRPMFLGFRKIWWTILKKVINKSWQTRQ